MPYIEYCSSLIFYETCGEGKPLLFIHDWNTSSRLFKRFCPAHFFKNYMVILFDLPGFGKSEMIHTMEPDTIRCIINKILDELCINEISVMGLCLGSVFALDYAIKESRRVIRLFLLEPIITFPCIFCLFFSPVAGRYFLRFCLKTKPGLWLFNRIALKHDGFYSKMLNGIVSKVNADNSLYYLKMLYVYSTINHYEKAKNINAKTVIITGSKTFKHIKKCAIKLNVVIPDSTEKKLGGVGHFLLLEAFNEICSIIENDL
ncbi:MAG: hypothetical protein A2015_11505 [Spirochaetes bacterium GWF1_31_7]|nr:MAG: hypothetical protein A2Y30_15570 [Spirochaetes bacterium GWE1_32_154]OHD49049.1 MAG: hypothetical protein A2015_11505 [Spirochaetes bacterium GWF1_31_7]OHD50367.1 MAG: hypothetical protein A2Y29_13620 [Spirochaetes bacterium GWE2_31_10]OHD75737.1 MAG: hypothetical protein A2355_00510 [Spirochaetes bacterium RIFOXYB1_FULL_32_8]HBD93844.1 hypothetical protein [Spirochaetia bacterium]